MAKYGIVARSRTETASLRQANNAEISSKTKEIVEGELLGDGNLHSRSVFSARYRHSSKYKEYLEWLRSQLGLECNSISKAKNDIAYYMATATYLDLYPLYKKWYVDGKKIIPFNLILTPTICLHWYLGDGSFDRAICRLATYNFSKSELEMTIFPQLAKFNPRFHKNGKYRRLALHPSFLDYIGNCPSAIKGLYGYKWPK